MWFMIQSRVKILATNKSLKVLKLSIENILRWYVLITSQQEHLFLKYKFIILPAQVNWTLSAFQPSLWTENAKGFFSLKFPFAIWIPVSVIFLYWLTGNLRNVCEPLPECYYRFTIYQIPYLLEPMCQSSTWFHDFQLKSALAKRNFHHRSMSTLWIPTGNWSDFYKPATPTWMLVYQ